MNLENRSTVEALLRQRPRQVVTVPMDKTLQATVTLMRQKDVDAVVIVDFCATEGEGVWGVLSRQNVIDALADRGLAAFTAPIGSLKTSGPAYCEVKQSLDELVNAMRQRGARHAVVMDRDMVVGVIDACEILLSRHPAESLSAGAA